MNSQKTVVYSNCLNERVFPMDHEFLPQELKSLINLEETCGAITYRAISNCFISPYGVIFKNGWLVMDSLYKMYPSKRNILTFYKKIALRRVKTISLPCLVAMNPFYDNYGHFLFECLPRIFATKAIHSSLCLIIPATAPKFVLEYASLFNFKEVFLMNERDLIHAKEAILPNSYDFGVQHYDLMRDLKHYLLSKLNTSTRGKRILLSRNKAAHRKSIEKEEELFLRLKEYSFERVFAEDLSVLDQIKTFSECDFLVGIHSTGLNNCLYMPAASTVIDIILKGHNDISVFNVSQISRQKFSFFLTARSNNHPLINFDNPEMDVDSIVKLVQKNII